MLFQIKFEEIWRNQINAEEINQERLCNKYLCTTMAAKGRQSKILLQLEKKQMKIIIKCYFQSNLKKFEEIE